MIKHLLIVGDMIFMDYRAALKPTVDTSYIDALGRPLLQVAGYKTFMYKIKYVIMVKFL